MPPIHHTVHHSTKTATSNKEAKDNAASHDAMRAVMIAMGKTETEALQDNDSDVDRERIDLDEKALFHEKKHTSKKDVAVKQVCAQGNAENEEMASGGITGNCKPDCNASEAAPNSHEQVHQISQPGAFAVSSFVSNAEETQGRSIDDSPDGSVSMFPVSAEKVDEEEDNRIFHARLQRELQKELAQREKNTAVA